MCMRNPAGDIAMVDDDFPQSSHGVKGAPYTHHVSWLCGSDGEVRAFGEDVGMWASYIPREGQHGVVEGINGWNVTPFGVGPRHVDYAGKIALSNAMEVNCLVSLSGRGEQPIDSPETSPEGIGYIQRILSCHTACLSHNVLDPIGFRGRQAICARIGGHIVLRQERGQVPVVLGIVVKRDAVELLCMVSDEGGNVLPP